MTVNHRNIPISTELQDGVWVAWYYPVPDESVRGTGKSEDAAILDLMQKNLRLLEERVS